jgi:alkylated DNA repair dioxygenase AlkB
MAPAKDHSSSPSAAMPFGTVLRRQPGHVIPLGMSPRVGLFSDPIVLAGGVGYYRGFIGPEEADELLAALLKLEWTQPVYREAGPDSPMYAWMGVRYMSQKVINKILATEWTSEARRIKLLVEEITGCAFDSLDLDLYRDHRDHIGLHSASNEGVLRTFPIAIVSLGAERRIKWSNIKDESTTTQLLEHGSLLLAPSRFQCENRHESPKQEKACGPRINLTFTRKVTP